MAQPNMTDMTGEKPLEDIDMHAQDSPTPQSVGAEDAGTGIRGGTQGMFTGFSRAKNQTRNQAFAARLRDAMNRGGLHPSEVARRVWGTVKDKRGHNTALNRDRIGHYLNGASYPNPETMVRLAEAVGLTVEELAGVGETTATSPAPGHAAAAGASGELILTSLPAQPTKIRIQVDRVIHWKLAARIQAMLKEAETGESVEDDGPQPGDLLQGGRASQ